MEQAQWDPSPSSSELMARHVLEALEQHGVTTSSMRVVDHDVKLNRHGFDAASL